jgi:uncharacterized protein
MNGLWQLLNRSPIFPRAGPFILFLIFTSLQGRFGPESHFYFYAAKTFAGIFLIWAIWPIVTEMRWAFSWEAVVAGVAVFLIWVGIDPYYPKWGKQEIVWNPHDQFIPAVAWCFIILRILGSGFIVPPLEEVFYRSFVYRWLIKPDFLSVPLNGFQPLSFCITCAIFGFAHNQWLAGILCGAIYQWLVIRKNRLGDAMTAHAITNILLGIYVAWKGQWQFW